MHNFLCNLVQDFAKSRDCGPDPTWQALRSASS